MSILSWRYRLLGTILDWIEAVKLRVWGVYKAQTVREASGAFKSFTATWESTDDDYLKSVEVTFEPLSMRVKGLEFLRDRYCPFRETVVVTP